MKLTLSTEALECAKSQLALDFKTEGVVETGIELVSAKRVGSIIELTEGTIYTAIVFDKKRYSVTLNFDHTQKLWSGRCACREGRFCAHHYAVLKSLVLAVDPMGSQTATTKSSKTAPVYPPFSLSAVLAAANHGKIPAAARDFLLKFDGVFERARKRQIITIHDFLALDLPFNHGLMSGNHTWPYVPVDAHRFWLFMARSLRTAGHDVPPFLASISDTTTVEEDWRKHELALRVHAWKKELAESFPGARVDAQESMGTFNLRVHFNESVASLQFQRPGNADFEVFRNNRQFDQFIRDRAEQRILLTPEGDMLLAIFEPLASYLSRPFELSYEDPASQRRLSQILRLQFPPSMLVSSSGHELVRDPAPLKWNLVAPDNDEGDYRMGLVRSDGTPVDNILFRLNIKPGFLATHTHIYSIPKLPPVTMQSGTELKVPAKALETAHGLALLQAMDLPPPARLQSRMERVLVVVTLDCSIPSRSYSSSHEQCIVRVTARSEDGKILETYTSRGWETLQEEPTSKWGASPTSHSLNKYAATPPTLSLDEDESNHLKVYDRSACDRVPELMASLNFKDDMFQRCFSIRVTKQFPDQFSGWLKSLPPEIKVVLDEELSSLAQGPVSGTVKLEVSEVEMDWFDLRVVLNVTDTTLTQEELRLLLGARGKFVRLAKKGWRRLEFQMTEEEDQRLAKLGISPRELSDEPQRLHALQLADEAAGKLLPEAQVEKIRRTVSEIKARVQPPVPASIKATLRPYQEEGFHFLAYLASNRFGGILADDMGLGKTLQTLTWLAWLREELPGIEVPEAKPGPSLVICPKSVMDNWHAEAQRFLGDLRVRVWTPGDIESFPTSADSADLHVLNYAQLRSVGESLIAQTWLALILDEGQYIKNPSSQSAQIARSLKAHHRLVLSGTPIENRLLDLWSLMAFAMPGALGSRAQFIKTFDNKEDPLARRRLASRVRPFLLRRTKAQVAKDLPDKIEEDLFCSIEGEQKTLYRAELKHAQQKLLQLQTQKQLDKERFNILVSLLRLRQICCHPRLVDPEFKGECAKVEALLDQLEPLMEEGHKVLVFSQFVELLQILQKTLKERSWKTFYLAGETEDRGKLVASFQKEPGSAVFLISLKAGGFGLNLTSANYVVLFDPWWNPAVENQAIDRTHRIGQTQKVIAYRLLIKDSIEEKIRALQRKKSALAEDVLGEERFSQSLTLSDLQFLFAD